MTIQFNLDGMIVMFVIAGITGNLKILALRYRQNYHIPKL